MSNKLLEGKKVLVTGGTGSLGKVLIRRLLQGDLGDPEQIVIFSRDEAKQHYLRLEYQNRNVAVDDFLYKNFHAKVSFRIGDIRSYPDVCAALKGMDYVFNTAALKQVPSCEYFPHQAVETNIDGAQNIVRAIREHSLNVNTVVGISTDKACQPVNVMGMTKAIQERIFIKANLESPETRFVVVRYGNVMASRGSVIPLFHEQIRNGGPITITTSEMTRFLLTLNDAVDLIFAALKYGKAGDTMIPRIPAAKVTDVAKVIIEDRKIEIEEIGIRPGEKIHETLISEEEASRAYEFDKNYFIIKSALPELNTVDSLKKAVFSTGYSSGSDLMDFESLKKLLIKNELLIKDHIPLDREILR